MPTLKELAEKVNMTPNELREWYPEAFEADLDDNQVVGEDLVSDIITAIGPMDTHPW